jgi:sugar lactone lactonase YvrE
VWWDPGSSSLVLTDETHGALLRWTEAAGFETIAKLPSSSGLGGVVRIPDGRLLVNSLGFGTDGAVFAVGANGEVATIPKLDPARRRTGLAVAPDGEVFVAYFTVTPGGGHRGGIAKLDPHGGETAVAESDLAKPVGVLATHTTLYITDQHSSALVAYARHDPTHTATIAASLHDPDLLAVLVNGDLVTGSRDGTIHRIRPGGEVTTLASGFEQVRGLAYDPIDQRLFVIEHSAATSQHHLHIVPVR